MLKRRDVLCLGVGCVAGAVGLGKAFGQPGGEARPARGGFDPQRIRQMVSDRIRETLKVGDDEWTVIQPRLEKVMTLSRDAAGGGMRGFFRRRRGNRPAAPEQPEAEVSDAQKITDELQALLDKEDAKADEIKAKLTELRKAREKAKDELAKARDALREVLTQRQEAQLVLSGLLD